MDLVHLLCLSLPCINDFTLDKELITVNLLQDKIDFELITLPALFPVLSTASGETLLLLVKHADLIINKVTDCPSYKMYVVNEGMRTPKLFGDVFFWLFCGNYGWEEINLFLFWQRRKHWRPMGISFFFFVAPFWSSDLKNFQDSSFFFINLNGEGALR